jgi:hypothetical protein
MGIRTDNGPILGSGWIHVLAAACAVFGGMFFYSTFRQPNFRSLAIGVLAASLIPFAFDMWRLWRVRSALGRADLELDDRIPLGFRGTATYTRPLRGAEMQSIEARLQCEEEIEKGSGRNRRNVTKIVHDEQLTPTITPMMERIEVRVPVRIPEAGPASFRCDVAETRWILRLRLKMRGCPNTASSFDIDVAPGVVQR